MAMELSATLDEIEQGVQEPADGDYRCELQKRGYGAVFARPFRISGKLCHRIL